uniref:B1 homeodomain mating type protein n=1 Tax=Heterobasidion abietinum TaxID=207833 RepID=S5RAI4_9AGAM|nr:b1 homeodomain mating type protein [Heterobasidion abietinum]
MPRHRLQHGLRDAPNELLSAVLNGPAALATFQRKWSRMVAEVDEEARHHGLDDDLKALTESTASLISILGESFSNLDGTAQKCHARLLGNLEDVLDHIHAPAPSSIDVAYKWLQRNLHDPYPSATVKQHLASSCGVSVEHIAAWFHGTRGRIGWTALARHHFQSSRSAMVEAAHRAFNSSDPSRPLHPDIEHAFSVIRQNLQCLDQPSESTDAIQDVTHPSTSKTEDSAVHDESQGGSEQKNSEISIVSHSLQLPNRLEDEEEEDMTPPPPIAGSKRRADIELEGDCISGLSQESGVRLIKRRRSDSSFTCHLAEPDDLSMTATTMSPTVPLTSMSTPPLTSTPSNSKSTSANTPTIPVIASSVALPIPSHPQTLLSPPTSHSTSPTPISRKRRSSDTSDELNPKRPCHNRSGLRMQAVSNPLPHNTPNTVCFESWCQAIDPTSRTLSVNDTPSPATTALNTPNSDVLCNELPTLIEDIVVPTQQIDLSDEAFATILASGYDLSSNFHQDVLASLTSLDDLFPSSLPNFSINVDQVPSQRIVDPGFNAMCTLELAASDLDVQLPLLDYAPQYRIPSLHMDDASASPLSLDDVCQNDNYCTTATATTDTDSQRLDDWIGLLLR